ncbi:isopentenyl transferase family protein [Mycolicibacterium boenickei]
MSILIGATASGKTAAATAYARETDAPVVVLDRFQCFQELAVVSGRPSDESLRSTTRIYLDDRRLADGEFSADCAYSALLQMLSELAHYEPLVILEGGSLSLCGKLMSTLDVLPYESVVHIRYVDIESSTYRAAVAERVKTMVGCDQAQPNLLDELRYAWRLKEQRGFLQSICGFDALLSWCKSNKIRPAAIGAQLLESSQRDDLVDLIAASHLQYARSQIQAFESWRLSMPGMADRIRRYALPGAQAVH